MEATNRKQYIYKGRPISVTEAAQLAGVKYATMYSRLNSAGMDVETAIAMGGAGHSLEDDAVNEIMDALGMSEQEPAEKPEQPAGKSNWSTATPEWKQQLRIINEAIAAIDALEDNAFDDAVVKDFTYETVQKLRDMRCRMYEAYIDWQEIAK